MMVYVEEKNIDRQFDLLKLLSITNEAELVAWIYPESDIDLFLDESIYSSTEIKAEPVTTYEKGIIPRCTKRLCVDDVLIEKLRSNSRFLASHCDSLCLYKVGGFEWVSCTIGHEGMGLVKNDCLVNELRSSGFNASIKAPDWW